MPFESDKIMFEVYKEATYSVFWTTPSPGPAGRDHPLPHGGEGTGVKQCAGTETLDEFSALLEAHVRKEERWLFPEFEKRMPADEAFKIGQEIESRLLKVCPACSEPTY